MNRIIQSILFSALTLLFFLQPGLAQTANAGARLEGQIVCCEDCWNKADRQKVPYGSPEDLAQSAKCVANGDPTLLAVMAQDGATKFYQLEDGKFKRPEPNWLSYVGSRVVSSSPSFTPAPSTDSSAARRWARRRCRRSEQPYTATAPTTTSVRESII